LSCHVKIFRSAASHNGTKRIQDVTDLDRRLEMTEITGGELFARALQAGAGSGIGGAK
jgi:hypothetical protein